MKIETLSLDILATIRGGTDAETVAAVQSDPTSALNSTAVGMNAQACGLLDLASTGPKSLFQESIKASANNCWNALRGSMQLSAAPK